MAIIGKVVYDDKNQLVYPSRRAVDAARSKLDLSTRATEDIDYVHLIDISAYGLTPSDARRNAQEKLERFFDVFEGKYGFHRMSVRKLRQSTEPINHNTLITYEVVYAIEYAPSRPRTRVPESPYAGSRRDTALVAKRPARRLTAPEGR